MPFSTIATPEAKPVANYKMATCHEGGEVLLAAGGDLNDLMKITTYITRIEEFPAVAEARSAIFQGELPASTLIVVKSLFHPDFLIEVEGIAAIGE